MRSPGSPILSTGEKNTNGHMWAQWLPNPCHLGGPQCFGRGTSSEMAHMWAQWLANPCHLGGPQCSARGQNQKWPTCGHSGYVSPAISGVPDALHEDKITNVHMWAQWLRNPCRPGGPQCSARGQNWKWSSCGHGGYVTIAVSRLPNSFNGGKNHKWTHVGTVAT